MDLQVLSGSDVDKIVDKYSEKPAELVNLMAEVFVDLAASSKDSRSLTVPHRSTIASENHRVLFMPARTSSFGTCIKIVSVPTAAAPLNVRERGLPASTAVLDEHTGEVIALVNARKLTALRNAASKQCIHLWLLTASERFIPGSLLATRMMLSSRTDEPRTLVAIGAGEQISAHISLFLSSYPKIRSCKIFNRTHNTRLTTLLDTLKSHAGIAVEGLALVDNAGAENPELPKALQGADIVVTATSSTLPLFPSRYISSGAHLCLIGSYTPAMYVQSHTDLSH